MQTYQCKTIKQIFGITLLSLAFGFKSYAVAVKNFQPKNWGLSEGASQIVKAWDLTTGSKNIIVAVIDTGIDATHPDLKMNLWRAPLTQTQNAPTVLKDSLVRSSAPAPQQLTSGSVYGWDFVTGRANPPDLHGHGTHIAGIIGAVANTKTGTAGVAQDVQLMPVRYYSDGAPGSVNLANTIKALNYAIDNGARIINYSGGGPEYSEEEYQAMKRAHEKGILIVAAAGNERKNTDESENQYYPAAYSQKGLTNIISVASLDEQNKLLPSSNYGMKSVDVAAPGEGILSTLPGGKYGKMSGTSQATAFVSGIAALVLSQRPDLAPAQVKEIILKNVELVASLKGKVATQGKVNALKVLKALSPERKTASK